MVKGLGERPRMGKGDYLFDGFAHRGFQEDIDGWINDQPCAMDYPAVVQAESTLRMFDELCAARREIWELKKRVRRHEDIFPGVFRPRDPEDSDAGPR